MTLNGVIALTGAKWGGLLKGVAVPQPTRRSGGVVSIKAVSGAESRPKTDLGVF